MDYPRVNRGIYSSPGGGGSGFQGQYRPSSNPDVERIRRERTDADWRRDASPAERRGMAAQLLELDRAAYREIERMPLWTGEEPNRMPSNLPASTGSAIFAAARFATGRNPTTALLQTLAQYLAERADKKKREHDRLLGSVGYVFPGFGVYAECVGPTEQYFDMSRSFSCFEVQGPGAYTKNVVQPAAQIIQTWEWISEAGQGPDGLQWGKAAITYMKLPGVSTPASAHRRPGVLLDPTMIDWHAFDPYTQPVPEPARSTDPHQVPTAPPAQAEPPTPQEVAYKPVEPGAKEIKLKFSRTYVTALKIFNGASEARDFAKALWDALPNKCKTKTAQGRIPKAKRKYQRLGKQTLPIMMRDIYKCSTPWASTSQPDGSGGYVQSLTPEALAYWNQAFENAVMNEIKDRLFGQFGRKGKESSQVAKTHGRAPVGSQMGQGSRPSL